MPLGDAVNRKLTITVSDDVYQGLYRTVGRRHISQFIEKLARSHVLPQDFEAAYRDMANDRLREQEAKEWSEGLIADLFPNGPSTSR